MDALGAMLDKLQKQVQVDIIEAGRSNRAADAKKAFTKVVNAEDAKLRTLFEKREAERKAKIQAALKELSEAEAALTEAHAEAARRLASEGAAVEASGRDFESLLQRKTHEFNGAAGACVKALADVTQTRARGHVDALRGDFLAEADRTKMEVAKMCVRVEEVAALLETQLAGMAAMMTMGAAGSKRGPSAGASQSMLLDEGEDEDDGYGYGGSAGAMDEDM